MHSTHALTGVYWRMGSLPLIPRFVYRRTGKRALKMTNHMQRALGEIIALPIAAISFLVAILLSILRAKRASEM